MFYSSYMPGDSYYPVPSLTVASFLHKTAGVAGFEPATNGLSSSDELRTHYSLYSEEIFVSVNNSVSVRCATAAPHSQNKPLLQSHGKQNQLTIWQTSTDLYASI